MTTDGPEVAVEWQDPPTPTPEEPEVSAELSTSGLIWDALIGLFLLPPMLAWCAITVYNVFQYPGGLLEPEIIFFAPILLAPFVSSVLMILFLAKGGYRRGTKKHK